MRQLKITQKITVRNEISVNNYFQEISRLSILTAEEEVELSVRIRNGDKMALEKLILSNLRFVVSVAKQYQNQGLSLPDLINEGNYGLVKAASRFDETKGFKFISYAVWWIRQSIIQAISNQTRIVRLPINRLSSIRKITKAIPYLEQEFEREPTEGEIADHLQLLNDEVKVASRIKNRELSFDKPLVNDDNNEATLYDVVQTDNIPSPDSDMMHESLSTDIQRTLNKLTEKEASILTLFFGLKNKPVHSLHDIALKYNMTTERIRQIKNGALSRLKSILEEKENIFNN